MKICPAELARQAKLRCPGGWWIPDRGVDPPEDRRIAAHHDPVAARPKEPSLPKQGAHTKALALLRVFGRRKCIPGGSREVLGTTFPS
jgi:hypothetical protein